MRRAASSWHRCEVGSANAHGPPHRRHFDGRGLRRCDNFSGGGRSGNLVGTATVGKDQRGAATLAGHHRANFRPFPASRATQLQSHRSFSAAKNPEAGAVRGRCRDRDRFSADRETRSAAVMSAACHAPVPALRLRRSTSRSTASARPRPGRRGRSGRAGRETQIRLDNIDGGL